MRSHWLVPMMFTFVAGCAGSVPTVMGVAAPRVAGRLMTPQGLAPAPGGTVNLGADPRFALRLDAESPAYVYLLRCSAGPCQVAMGEPHRVQPGVPLLLSGPGGWLSMAQTPSEELRVLASAAPLSAADIAERGESMGRREPETTTPDKRGAEELVVYADRGVAVLTVILKKN